MNFDVNQIRSITRGEVNGSARFVAGVLAAALVWGGGIWLSGMAENASSALALWQANYRALSQLAVEFKALTAGSPLAGADVMTSFTQVSAQISLGSRVSRIVPATDGKKCTIEINRLYAEELTDMVRELSARGVRVISAEIRALPAGEERLFTLTAVIGTEI